MSADHFENFSNISYNSKIWQQCLTEIQNTCQGDYLYKNYLNIDPESYLFFNGVMRENKIIAFGAIEKSPNKWGDSLVRVLTRFWIHPSYRSKGLTKWGDNKIRFSPLVLKPQIEFLKSYQDVKIAMITREGKNLKSFREITRLANTVNDCKFEIVNGKFNVCEPMDFIPYSCKQFIALSPLVDFDYVQYLKEVQQLGMLLKVS